MQRKEERLAQLRDDPYYIIDDRPKKLEDVDSIPVVHLDDMPPIASGKQLFCFLDHSADRPMTSDVSNGGLPILRETSQTFSFVIDKGGEMPEGAALRQSQLNPQHSSSPAGISSPAPVIHGLSSFPKYEVPEDSSVEPIKVARQKKTKPGKKKRTVTAT